jgi:hypothetical protein
MGFCQCGQSVVDGMGAGQSAAFKADAGKQGVGLNDMLQGRGDDLLLRCGLGGRAVAQQGIVAEPGQVKAGQGTETAAGVCRTGGMAERASNQLPAHLPCRPPESGPAPGR